MHLNANLNLLFSHTCYYKLDMCQYYCCCYRQVWCGDKLDPSSSPWHTWSLTCWCSSSSLWLCTSASPWSLCTCTRCMTMTELSSSTVTNQLSNYSGGPSSEQEILIFPTSESLRRPFISIILLVLGTFFRLDSENKFSFRHTLYCIVCKRCFLVTHHQKDSWFKSFN